MTDDLLGELALVVIPVLKGTGVEVANNEFASTLVELGSVCGSSTPTSCRKLAHLEHGNHVGELLSVAHVNIPDLGLGRDQVCGTIMLDGMMNTNLPLHTWLEVGESSSPRRRGRFGLYGLASVSSRTFSSTTSAYRTAKGESGDSDTAEGHHGCE